MDYGNTRIPSIHRRLGSTTLSQLAFPREKQPKFPMGEVSMGQHKCKKKKKIKERKKEVNTFRQA